MTDPVLLQQAPFHIWAVPVLHDNFVYLVCRGRDAVLVDAGAAGPVETLLQKEGLALRRMLITHRHGDHTAGAARLQARIQPGGQVPEPVEAIALPGHTADDQGYYYPSAGVVFTGDCLINGACGRVIGGSMPALFESIQRIKQLPGETLVLGGHDYLMDNLQFGLQQEPGDPAIQARMALYKQNPTAALFATLAEEQRTNVFLQAPDLATFSVLRHAKDHF